MLYTIYCIVYTISTSEKCKIPALCFDGKMLEHSAKVGFHSGSCKENAPFVSCDC